MTRTVGKLSLQDFLELPESGDRHELVDGELKPKMSPTTPHSRAQKRLVRFLDDWCEETGAGEGNPEWTLTLKRQGADWAPVPDVAFISRERIPADWDGEGPCPAIPELAIEIISPGQSFGELTQKATDYLTAGVDRVWIVDTRAQLLTIFRQDTLPQTLQGEEAISDSLLPGLVLSMARLFGKPAQGS